MISLFNSKTEMPVPSKATLDGSFCDLKRKNTEEDMMLELSVTKMTSGRYAATAGFEWRSLGVGLWTAQEKI